MPSNWRRTNGGRVACNFRGRRFSGTDTADVLGQIETFIKAEKNRKAGRRAARFAKKAMAHGGRREVNHVE